MADKVRVSPQDATNKWRTNFAAAGPAYELGVSSVTTAPNARAALSLPKYLASINSKRTQDKFVANNNKVTLSAWQEAAKTFGSRNLSSGADKGAGKMTAFATKFYPFLSQGLAKINAMPNITLQDRINRAVAMMQYNATFVNS